MRAEDISPTMCIMPWKALATDPNGGLYPCCIMSSDKKYRGSPLSYKESSYLKSIKETFLSGKYPEQCRVCRWNDKNNLRSKRKTENEVWEKRGNSWKDYDKDTGFIKIDLRLSNLCDLGCMMCSPKNSSYITKESKENLYLTIPEHYQKGYDFVRNDNLLSPYNSEDIDALLDLIEPNSILYCTGGGTNSYQKNNTTFREIKRKGL